MSFLEELKVAKRSGLRKTETRLRTSDGRVFEEQFNDVTGEYVAKKTGQESFGWVGDTKLDLQLAEARKNLYFGSQDVASDQELLKQNGITHILNLAPTVQNFFPENFKYLKLPILDFPETDISQHFAQTNQFLDKSLSCGGKVFVHCNAGVSRATTIVVAYIVTSQKISVEDVLKHLKVIRPCVCPNKGFLKQLKDYEKTLFTSGDEGERRPEIPK